MDAVPATVGGELGAAPASSAQLLEVAVEAARTAGSFLLDGRGHARSIDTKSSSTDMVSEMDRQAEALIRAVIAKRRPADAVLGEEGGAGGAQLGGAAGAQLGGAQLGGAGGADHPEGGGVRWVVDPLDGTTNFLYGFPVWAVSVAAERGGTVVAGAVLDPGRDELWTAVPGGGARCNGDRLQPLVDRGGLDTALVATGFAYRAERREAQGRVVGHLLPRIRDIRRSGSAALDLCWLAAGRVDAYYEEGTWIWDWAAGALVAREAGAWVGGFDGGPPSGRGVLAARPTLAAELRALLSEADAGASLRPGRSVPPPS